MLGSRHVFLVCGLALSLAGPAVADENAVTSLAAEVIAKEKIAPLGYYVVGSHATGNIKPHSDIDVLAIVPQQDKSYRQTSLVGKQPYQIAVYGLNMMPMQFESERVTGNNVVMRQIAQGKILKDTDSALAGLQQRAQQLYAAGPRPMTAETSDVHCYRVKSWLDDFSDDRPAPELRALLFSLYPALADYYLRSHGYWTAGGAKWLYRALKEANPDFAARLDTGAEAFIKTGDKQLFMRAANEALVKATCDVNNHRIIDPPFMTGASAPSKP